MADNITTFNITYNQAQAAQQTQALIKQLESKFLYSAALGKSIIGEY